MPLFSKKNVYHSWLVSKSPLVIQFTSEPKKSNYNDNYFVWFKVRGDDDPEASYCYTIENATIVNTIRGADSSKWYECIFSANQTTTLDMGGDEATVYQQMLEISELGAAPPSTFKRKDGQKVVSSQPNDVNLIQCYKDCMNEAVGIFNAGFGVDDELPETATIIDMVQRIGNSLFIQWGYRGFAGTLDGDSGDDVDVRDNEAASEDTAEPSGDGLIDDLRSGIDKLPSKSGTAHDDRGIKTVLNKIEKVIASGEVVLEDYVKMGNWLRNEFDHQKPEDTDDDLPF